MESARTRAHVPMSIGRNGVGLEEGRRYGDRGPTTLLSPPAASSEAVCWLPALVYGCGGFVASPPAARPRGSTRAPARARGGGPGGDGCLPRTSTRACW